MPANRRKTSVERVLEARTKERDTLTAQNKALRSALTQMLALCEAENLDELHGDCCEVARAALALGGVE